MNQEKIGKFIYNCRKEKGMTQCELATLLNVTNKAVSKWENGYSLPDYSLLIPLCEIFDISVNDLLGGEKSNESSEINMINAIRFYRKQGVTRWKKVLFSLLVIITMFFLAFYMMTNFGKSKIYAIKSDSQEFVVQGYVISNQKQNIITLSKLEYNVDYNVFCLNQDYECEDIKIRNLNVYLYNGIEKIKKFEVEKDDDKVSTLTTLLKDISIDINDENITQPFEIENNNLRLIISYENEKYQNINIELKLNLKKIYENNRLFY